jgi:hypothetical protein
MSHQIGRFGGASDFAAFESDGTLVNTGAATTFDDRIGDALSLKVSGVGISTNAAEGTQDFAVTANLSDYLYSNLQITHRWKIDSTIYPHLHFFQTVAGAPNFLLEYRWQSNDAAKTTAWTRLLINTLVFTYTSGALNQIARTASGITASGKNLSDIIQFRLYRDNANSSGLFAGVDPVAATVGIMSFDTHFELDTLGSRQQYTK